MAHQITVTGVLPAPGQIGPRRPVRKNFNDFVKDEKQFALYIQALIAMQAQDQPQVLSWFAVSGIHGLPHVPWDSADDKPEWGYCAHATVNFPTWHRPYVALFEQDLQARSVKLAEQYRTQVDEWKKAAAELRSPFWDWASDAVPAPEVIRLAQLEIETPGGRQRVANPLFAYRFHPVDPSFEPPYNTIPTTVRNAQPDDPNTTNVEALVESLQGLDGWLGDGLRAETYKTLTLLKDWKVFSNKGYQPKRGALRLANSLESIHDIIHVTVGGNGHMSDPSYAAFDPIFWLHHTNVDRLLALWQAMNPAAGVIAKDGPEAELANADLTPFWNGPKTFYKSSEEQVANWTDLNYTYPEFVGLEGQSPAQVTAGIRRKVNDLYGSRVRIDSAPAAQAQVPAPAPAQAPVSFAAAPQPAQAPVFISLMPAGPHDPHRFTEWYVRVRAKRFEMRISYSVLVFIGPPPAAPAQWRTSPNLAGVHAEFVNSHREGCANCEAQRDKVTEGFVSITEFLKRRGFGEKSEEEIDAYLKENLHWRIQKVDGSVVSAEEFASLEIAVMTVPLAAPHHDHVLGLPEGALPTHRNVTGGRAGGRN